jgi:hypothetical protein
MLMQSSRDAIHYAPTTRFAVAVFLIGGPLIYFPVDMAFQGDLVHAPITAIYGFMFWSILLLSLSGWFMGWIPTTAAAVICAYCLRALARNAHYQRMGNVVRLVMSAILCGLISGIVYFPCLRIAIIIHPPPPGYMEGVARSALTEHYPMGIRLTSFGGGVLVVIVTGSILGTWLAWRADTFNASVHRAAN